MHGRSGSFALDRTPNSDCEVDARECFHQLVSPRRGYLFRVAQQDRGQKIKVARTSPMGVLSTPRMVSVTAR